MEPASPRLSLGVGVRWGALHTLLSLFQQPDGCALWQRHWKEMMAESDMSCGLRVGSLEQRADGRRLRLSSENSIKCLMSKA